MPVYIALNIVVHIQDIGDLSHHDREWAGVKGQSKRLEGFQIATASGGPPPFEYMAHLQDQGDTPWLPAGQFIGTRGLSRRLEGFAVRMTPYSSPHTVRYRAHLEGTGDTTWSYNGVFCGTRYQSKRLEAIWVEIFEGDNT